MNNGLGAQWLHERWIQCQQWGLLAHVMAAEPVGSQRWIACHDLLQERLGNVPLAREGLNTIPFNVLPILQGVLAGVGPLASESAGQVSRSLSDIGKTVIGPYQPRKPRVASKRLAYQLVFRGASAREIARAFEDCGQSDLGEAIRAVEGEADSALSMARSTDWTATRVEGICRFISLLTLSEPLSTHLHFQVGFAAIQLQYIWPLLLLTDDVGMSLPLELDLSSVRPGGDRVQLTGAGGRIDITLWRSVFRTALDSAKARWKAQHGRFANRQIEIRSLGVIADISVGQQIVETLPSTISSFVLDEKSATDCFAGVLLGRMCGTSYGSATTTTARERGKLVPPRGVKAKLRVARTLSTVDRVVLPTGSETEALSAATTIDPGFESAVQLAFVADDNTLIDALNAGQWRRYKYFRTPEIRAALHSAEKDEAADVAGFLSELQFSDGPVLETSVSAHVVAKALWQIRQSTGPNPHPALSWAFIRVFESEMEDLIWQIFADCCGAPQAELAQLITRSKKREDVLRIVASWVNEVAPSSGSAGFWAPDFTVFCLPAYAEGEPENYEGRVVSFLSVLRELNSAEFRVSRNRPGDSSWIYGMTRVIVTYDEELSPDPSSELVTNAMTIYNGLSRDEQVALNQLSVLRAGFDTRVAAAVAGLSNDLAKCRGTLAELRRKHAVGYSGGEWYVPARIRAYAQTFLDEKQAQALHGRAVIALLPFTATDPASVGYDVAMRPHNLAEAHHHQGQAAPNFSKLSQRALGSIGPASWGALHEMVKCAFVFASPGYRLACDLIGEGGVGGLGVRRLMDSCIAAALHIANPKRKSDTQLLTVPLARFKDWSKAGLDIDNTVDRMRFEALRILIFALASRLGIPGSTFEPGWLSIWPDDLSNVIRTEHFVSIHVADRLAIETEDPGSYRTAAWAMAFPISALVKALGMRKNGEFIMDMPGWAVNNGQLPSVITPCREAYLRNSPKKQTREVEWWGTGLDRLEFVNSGPLIET